MDIDSGEESSTRTSKIEKKLSPKNKDQTTEKDKHKSTEETNEEAGEEDEFNLSLAAMENEIKPKVLKTIADLKKKYTKLASIHGSLKRFLNLLDLKSLVCQ